jgi:hypothetical protein
MYDLPNSISRQFSRVVYLYVQLKKGKKYIVLPSTRNPGEEGEFTLSVHSHQKASLKSKD